MKIIKITDKNAKNEALECLKTGGILIYPTETCYGVGVDATNTDAVSRVLEYKKRPEGKAISIGVYDEIMASKYVEINSTAKNFYTNFLPGPVTVVSKSKNITDSRLESEKGTMGIRIPNYKFMLELIKDFGKPITTTSANSSGKKTPYSVQDILDNLSEKQKELIDLIIDAGELPHNPPSTVIDTTGEKLTVYRQGQLDPSKITKSEIRNSESVTETESIGGELIQNKINEISSRPIVILLNGELGAGKTHMTKGIAKSLGITQVIKSPTYNYVNEYKISSGLKAQSPKLYHLDAWRIETIADLRALGFDTWFIDGNVIVIEWPTVIMNLDPEFFEKMNYTYIDFINLTDTSREIRIYEVSHK